MVNKKQLLNEILEEFKSISKKIEKLLNYIAINYKELDKTTLSLLETQGCYMMKYRDILLLRMNNIKFENKQFQNSRVKEEIGNQIIELYKKEVM